jgi:hypothetical protein
MGKHERIQVIFGPTADFVYLNAYDTDTEDRGDFYDEIISKFSIISCKEDADVVFRWNIELLFQPTGDSLHIKGYLTYEESETAIHDEVRHYLEVNGFHRHRASWSTLDNDDDDEDVED